MRFEFCFRYSELQIFVGWLSGDVYQVIMQIWYLGQKFELERNILELGVISYIND